jgi:hypothetical protein
VTFYTANKCGAKKGGVDGLGKLRSGAKRNGVILTFLICGGSRLMQNAIANIHRLPEAAPVCGGSGECFPSPYGRSPYRCRRFLCGYGSKVLPLSLCVTAITQLVKMPKLWIMLSNMTSIFVNKYDMS